MQLLTQVSPLRWNKRGPTSRALQPLGHGDDLALPLSLFPKVLHAVGAVSNPRFASTLGMTLSSVFRSTKASVFLSVACGKEGTVLRIHGPRGTLGTRSSVAEVPAAGAPAALVLVWGLVFAPENTGATEGEKVAFGCR